jgi:hypothetical protein
MKFLFLLISFVRIGGIGSSLFLVLIGYVGCSKLAAMFCITLAVAFLGVHSTGCQISHLDIGSNYAGLLNSFFFKFYCLICRNTCWYNEYSGSSTRFCCTLCCWCNY